MAVYTGGLLGHINPARPYICLPIAARAGVARPSSEDRWSLLEKGHTAQCSLSMGLHRSSQEQTRSPSVGNIQEIQSVRPE